jgi:disulfide bond formation protein DsbB
LDKFVASLRQGDPAAVAAAFLAGGAAVILGFLFFQFVMGLPPCPLCLEQRYSYYFGVPLAAMLVLGANYGASRKVLMLGFAALALAMLWTAAIGVYHAGVEWKFWQGPTDCSGPLNDLSGPGGLLKQLQSISVVRCDEAAWRLFGISLPGWNVLVSLVLAALAAHGFLSVKARPEKT